MAYTVNVIDDKCVGCTRCTLICPTGTLAMDNNKRKAYTTDVVCDNAWGCIYACPTRAIEIVEVKNENSTQY